MRGEILGQALREIDVGSLGCAIGRVSLRPHLAGHGVGASPRDVQATLLELSAACISQALQIYAPGAIELLVCGGGVFNSTLMDRLQARLPTLQVLSTDQRGLPAMQVDAFQARSSQARTPSSWSS